jgi:hypothetical protein
MADTKTILILAGVGIGGYMLYKSTQQPAVAYQPQPQQPGTPGWGELAAGLASGLSSLFGSSKGKIVSKTGTQQVPGGALSSGTHSSGTSTNWTPPSSSTPSPTLGSLGSYGDGGSLGGCSSLGCNQYGSLG